MKTKFKNIVEAEKQLEELQSEHFYRYQFWEVFEEHDAKDMLVGFRIGSFIKLRHRFDIDEETNIIRPL